MFISTCILMLNNGMPPRVAGNRLSSYLIRFLPASLICLLVMNLDLPFSIPPANKSQDIGVSSRQSPGKAGSNKPGATANDKPASPKSANPQQAVAELANREKVSPKQATSIQESPKAASRKQVSPKVAPERQVSPRTVTRQASPKPSGDRTTPRSSHRVSAKETKHLKGKSTAKASCGVSKLSLFYF